MVFGCLGGETQEQLNAKLLKACHEGRAVKVQGLITCGADVNAVDKNGNSVLHITLSSPHVEKAPDSTPSSPSLLFHGHPEIAMALIAEGANIDARDEHNNTALHLAARYGHTDAVNKLIAEGADIHATNEDGNTALHLAARSGHVHIVKNLLTNGADMHAENTEGKRAMPMLAKARKSIEDPHVRWV